MSTGDKMKKEFAETLGEKLSMPPEALGEIPVTEIRGNRSVTVENHRGILEYSDEIVKISVRHGTVTVHGTRLKIVSMSGKLLEIRGSIRNVEME